MVELAQLISSAYAKHIKADAQDMLTKLKSVNESFQLLVKLEAEWLRLEPIFDVEVYKGAFQQNSNYSVLLIDFEKDS